MATHRTTTALVSAATVGALALGVAGSAAAADEPKPPVRNQSVIVDDLGRLADANTELTEKLADDRSHSVQVRAARTHLDSVLLDARRLADLLNKDSDRSVSADTAALDRASRNLRIELDELTGVRVPAPDENADNARSTRELTDAVTTSVTNVFKSLGIDKLVGDLRQRPAAQPAAQPANRPVAQPAGQADDTDADDEPAAQPKAPTSDPQPPADAPRQQPADQQRPAGQQAPADQPQQQPADQAQQPAGSLLNSVLTLPATLLKALGL
ncbi:hypothetical protein ACH4OW_18720 [Streptomyces sp. NPDC017056]|uniref:hypothetical protein n=1 Tax=Streptomyces sp. NPDC017056 TaxID=3364973 RepID=UPI0037B26AC1